MFTCALSWQTWCKPYAEGRGELSWTSETPERVLLARGHLELLDRLVALGLDLLQLPGRRLPQRCAVRVQRLAGAKLAI